MLKTLVLYIFFSFCILLCNDLDKISEVEVAYLYISFMKWLKKNCIKVINKINQMYQIFPKTFCSWSGLFLGGGASLLTPNAR